MTCEELFNRALDEMRDTFTKIDKIASNKNYVNSGTAELSALNKKLIADFDRCFKIKALLHQFNAWEYEAIPQPKWS